MKTTFVQHLLRRTAVDERAHTKQMSPCSGQRLTSPARVRYRPLPFRGGACHKLERNRLVHLWSNFFFLVRKWRSPRSSGLYFLQIHHHPCCFDVNPFDNRNGAFLSLGFLTMDPFKPSSNECTLSTRFKQLYAL